MSWKIQRELGGLKAREICGLVKKQTWIFVTNAKKLYMYSFLAQAY